MTKHNSYSLAYTALIDGRRFWLFLTCLLLLASCGPDRSDDGLVTMTRGLVGSADNLDPQRNSSVQGHQIMVDLFEGLLRYSSTGALENGMAKDWSVSDDGLLYSFTLRKDGKWSNGDPVTARDFEFAFRRLVDPKTAAFYAGFVSTIVNAPAILRGEKAPSELGVVATDDYSLQIRLSERTAYFPQLLTHPATMPLHRPSVEEFGNSFTRAGNLVSNGAYMLDAFTVGGNIRLVRNTNYRENNLVAIDVVNYLQIVSDDAMYMQYRAGEIHVTGTVPSAHFEAIRRERPNELKVAPLLGVYYYGFNMTRPPFGDNIKLRQALSMAIDREVLVEKVTVRGEMPAYSWVPPGIEGYDPPGFSYSKMSAEERHTEARRLYKEAGFGPENPAKFDLRYNIGEGEQRIALAIQSMWAENLGAEASIINEEFQVLLANIQQKTITEVYRLSWIGDYFDPHTFLQLMETTSPSNLTGYSNPEFDRLMQLASQEIESNTRMALFREAESLMLADHPAMPIYYYVSKYLVRSDVHGWVDTIIDFHPTRFLSLESKSTR